jgi:hypothetical protein
MRMHLETSMVYTKPFQIRAALVPRDRDVARRSQCSRGKCIEVLFLVSFVTRGGCYSASRRRRSIRMRSAGQVGFVEPR